MSSAAQGAACAVGRALAGRVTSPFHAVGPGFEARRVAGTSFPAGAAGPLLNMDHFRMERPFFRPHPHAGFIAATFLFADSPTAVQNRDSLSGGAVTHLQPGGVYWFAAGAGAVHEQIPAPGGRGAVHGLQCFFDLPRQHKLAPPRLQLLPTDQVPTFTTGAGVRVRVLAGAAGGVAAPLEQLTEVCVLELHMPAGAEFTHTPPAGHTAALLHMVSGQALLPPGVAAAPLGADDSAAFTPCGANEGDAARAVRFSAGAAGAHAVLFTGAPLAQPVVWGGPFCMSSAEELAGRQAAYARGEMGTLDPSPVQWARP
jgi:hypothetical protein